MYMISGCTALEYRYLKIKRKCCAAEARFKGNMVIKNTDTEGPKNLFLHLQIEQNFRVSKY